MALEANLKMLDNSLVRTVANLINEASREHKISTSVARKDKQRIGGQGKVSIFRFPWWIKTITAIKLLLGQLTLLRDKTNP